MEDEASWVGLGWNLSRGAINRNIRGMPANFYGEQIKHTTSNFGGSVEADVELYGVGFSASLAIKYNN